MSPKIHVLCKAEQSQLVCVTLGLADSFSYEIQGADPSLKNFLIGWLTLYARRIPPQSPLPLQKLTLFQQTILTALSQIPFGATISYRELGKRCGFEMAARAVGGVCKRNPFPLLIPCHRVICSDGSLGGFALDRTIKERLLAFEGGKN